MAERNRYRGTRIYADGAAARGDLAGAGIGSIRRSRRRSNPQTLAGGPSRTPCTYPPAPYGFPDTRSLVRPLNGAFVVKIVHRLVP